MNKPNTDPTIALTSIQRPTVGRIVHYVILMPGIGAMCSAALVTRVPDHLSWEPMDGCANGTDGQWEVNLAAFHPYGGGCGAGTSYPQDVRYDPSGAAGTWHWPERE